jgi:hypothetical protein
VRRITQRILKLFVGVLRGNPKLLLFNKRQQFRLPTHQEEIIAAVLIAHPRRKPAVRVVVLMSRQSDLMKVVLTLCPICCFTDALNCGQKYADENRYYTNYDKEFDQSESFGSSLVVPHGYSPN